MKRTKKQRLLALAIVCVTILSLAVPAAAAGNNVQLTENGLYVTDDGLYGVYVIPNDPGSVAITEYFGATAPKNLVVPSHVQLNGIRVPVAGLECEAYANHTEIETVELAEGIRYLEDEPFYGCTGVRKITLPSSIMSMSAGPLFYFDQFIEVEERNTNGVGFASDYLDVSFSPQNFAGGQQVTVTFTLKDGVESFPAYVYTQPFAVCDSMEPEDPDPDTVSEGRVMVRLGIDPETGYDYGRSRTYRFHTTQEGGQNVEFNIAGSVPRLDEYGKRKWVGAGFTRYMVPNNPRKSTPIPHDFEDRLLPIPSADMEPLQQEALEATNLLRDAKGLKTLELDSILSQAAMVRATEMALAEDLSHTRPKGNEWLTVVTNLSNHMAENIVLEPGVSPDGLGTRCVREWEASPNHYKNMMTEDFNRMGIGFARSRSGRWYACQLLANVYVGFRAVTVDGVQLLEPYRPENFSLDKTALEAAVQEADRLWSETTVSKDGTDVPPTQMWATPDAKGDLSMAAAREKATLANPNLTQAGANAAAARLQAAIEAFKAARQPGTRVPADLRALSTALQEAKKIFEETVASADGTNVLPSQRWTKPEQKQFLQESISDAEKILNGGEVTQEAVDDAVDSLQRAVKHFVSYRHVSQQDKEPLKSAAEAARALHSATVSSRDGAEVSSAQYWATPEEMRTLSAEISVAEVYVSQRDVTQALLDYASQKLQQAVDVFASARRPGLKAGSSPVPSAAPTASVPPGTGGQPTASATPGSSAAPAVPVISGYQGGRLNGKTYHAKTSGAGMLFYLEKSTGALGRVSAPYVTDRHGTRYYPVNCGGTVLFPRLEGGVLTAYCIYKDGMEIPVLAVQFLPAADGSMQTFLLNGKTYYARTSGAGMLFYLKKSSGALGRVSAPYVTDQQGTRYYPVNCGGTIMAPRLEQGALAAYTAAAAGSTPVLIPVN